MFMGAQIATLGRRSRPSGFDLTIVQRIRSFVATNVQGWQRIGGRTLHRGRPPSPSRHRSRDVGLYGEMVTVHTPGESLARRWVGREAAVFMLIDRLKDR